MIQGIPLSINSILSFTRITRSELPSILNPVALPSAIAKGVSPSITGGLPCSTSLLKETLARMERTHLPLEKNLKLPGFPLYSPTSKKGSSASADILVFPRATYSQPVNLERCLQKIRVFEEGLRAVVIIIQL